MDQLNITDLSPEAQQQFMDEKLKELLQRELDGLDIKADKIKKLYDSIGRAIEHTSELTGIPQSKLISICVRTSHQYADLTWHDILDIVRAFYVSRDQLFPLQEVQA